MHIDTSIPLSPVDFLIAGMYLLIFGVSYFEKIKAILILLEIFMVLLKLYKHVAPMLKHYIDTHPAGRKLKEKTNLDNKIDYLIKTHQLPYDNKGEPKG